MGKTLVALSGGVDSAVAMLLLRERGEKISAAYMKTWMNEDESNFSGDCPWHEDIEDAKACCEKLRVPFEVVDFIKEYEEQIVRYMVDGYKNGLTPNPDVMCNRRIKFGKFLDYALSKGFENVATGHYCGKLENPDGTCDLVMGADPGKDQSYFLSMITQEQLKRAEFPIGSLLKSEVRDTARLSGLPNAEKKDSQGICFLGKVKIKEFLKSRIPENPGSIVRRDGKVLGRHMGLHNYTIGQRHGMGIPSNSDGKSYVVVSKNFDSNELVVDFDSPDIPDLYKNEVVLGNWNWINEKIDGPLEVSARVRYRDPCVKAFFEPLSKDLARVSFDKPQRGIARGQVLALYIENKLVGSAFF